MLNKSQIENLILEQVKKFPINLEKSDTRSLPITVRDQIIYVNPKRISLGNEKLVDMYIFDLPAGSPNNGGTCLNSRSCEKDCYAKQQQIQYPPVPIFRLINLYLFVSDKDYLRELIEKQFNSQKKTFKTFRIHSSGDFYNQSEIDFWTIFIQDHPEINFYAYTKVDHIFDFSKITSLDNFNLIPSVILDNEVSYRNFGTETYIKRLALKINGFLCPATMMETKGEISCNKGCTYCVSNNKPLFLIHGKGRNIKRKDKLKVVA